MDENTGSSPVWPTKSVNRLPWSSELTQNERRQKAKGEGKCGVCVTAFAVEGYRACRKCLDERQERKRLATQVRSQKNRDKTPLNLRWTLPDEPVY